MVTWPLLCYVWLPTGIEKNWKYGFKRTTHTRPDWFFTKTILYQLAVRHYDSFQRTIAISRYTKNPYKWSQTPCVDIHTHLLVCMYAHACISWKGVPHSAIPKQSNFQWDTNNFRAAQHLCTTHKNVSMNSSANPTRPSGSSTKHDQPAMLFAITPYMWLYGYHWHDDQLSTNVYQHYQSFTVIHHY